MGYSNYPSRQRSPWFYVLMGCGGCACLALVVIIVGVSLLGWGLKRGIEDMAAMARQAKVDLKLEQDKMVTKEGKRYIEGSIKNISPTHTYDMATVEYNLFDKTGKSMESSSANTRDLKPGSVWKFEVPVKDAAVATYKFREVTGFQDVTEDPKLSPEKRAELKARRDEMRRRIDEAIKKAQDDSGGQNRP